ncbi:MAG: flippase-like domain-containing protein [Acidobacteriia bacterium]|nr:flippase-like domain-containing protein [Terriglobia bacterium]
MNKHRLTVYGLALAVLAALVYLQFREWRTFDWGKFIEHSRDVTWRHVIHGIVLIYLAYILRAIRWKIFLRPVRKDVSSFSMISPTLVGFTGLAVLGRPGELIRPYLIARRVNLSFSSQLAVWAVERIFDLAAFTVLMVAGIFLPTKLRAFAAGRPEVLHWLHLVGYFLSLLVVALLVGALLVNYHGSSIANWVEQRFSHLAKNLGHRVAQRVREFASGLNTIHSVSSLVQLSVVSLVMWWLIALSYKEVTHSYGAPMQDMSVTRVLLLMGSSMAGSMVQLPGVGGGSQLATIEAMDKIFHIPQELSVSCGILLWLVTFVAVVPAGLLLAHHERLSLLKVAEASQQEEASAVIPESRVT